MSEALARLGIRKGGPSRLPHSKTKTTPPPALESTPEVPRPLDSGVYVKSSRPEVDADLVKQVTLVVYEWHNVEPGTLWWVFPSVQAALSAARAMKNAVKWAIVAGKRTAKVDVAHERESGLVLAEQAG